MTRLPLLAVAIVLAVTACGGDDDGQASPDPRPPRSSTTVPPSCGVTLAQVQDLLPPGSGVTQNPTPDPGRCNFTWTDGGPRGIDVAIVDGGRATFEVPAGYEPLDGYGDDAYTSSAPGRASAVAFVGDDLYAADAVTDTADTNDTALHDLCLQVLDLALD